MKMKAIEMFCGAGGFSRRLTKSGFEILFANDIDECCCQTYKSNHPNTFVHREDIHELKSEFILDNVNLKKGDIDLVVGGPPCQGFSTLGSKKEEDPRNNLFLPYLRIVQELNPEFVVFENVTGFYKMYGGKAFAAVKEGFSKLGYSVKSEVLNAMHYGVPQIRERTIIVAHKEQYEFNWPVPTHGTNKTITNFDSKLDKPLTLKDALSDLPLIKVGEEATEYTHPPLTQYQKDRRERSEKLLYHKAPNHGESLMSVIKLVPEGGSILDIPENKRPKSYFPNSYARLNWNKPSTTITRNFGTPSSARCIHPLVDRGLTTREGARLQSFDDDYLFVGSTVSINLQIGNAVPPLLAKAIVGQVNAALQA
jgi:DNA (cytosine-5)-methyltransferase 1